MHQIKFQLGFRPDPA